MSDSVSETRTRSEVDLRQDLLDATIERRNVVDDGLPHDLEINAEVVVNHAVAHVCDALPLDIGMPLRETGVDAFDGFADDFEIFE